MLDGPGLVFGLDPVDVSDGRDELGPVEVLAFGVLFEFDETGFVIA